MAEPSFWSALLKWVATLIRKMLPERLLRLAWPNQKLLAAIEVFSFDQAPRFYVRSERPQHELHIVGFNVFNFSPFKLAIVGAELQIVLDSQTFLAYRQRLPTETPIAPYARGGFHFALLLNESQTQQLRAYPCDWTLIRVRGDMIVKGLFGELRKPINADIVAVIDRDVRAPPR